MRNRLLAIVIGLPLTMLVAYLIGMFVLAWTADQIFTTIVIALTGIFGGILSARRYTR